MLGGTVLPLTLNIQLNWRAQSERLKHANSSRVTPLYIFKMCRSSELALDRQLLCEVVNSPRYTLAYYERGQPLRKRIFTTLIQISRTAETVALLLRGP